ncbi:hypothetical protein RSOL_045900, partial [Rhizoctonia solani AG-3 Rhs1AP]
MRTTPQASGSISSRPKPLVAAKRTSGGVFPSMPTPKHTPTLMNVPIVPLSDEETPVLTPIASRKGKGYAPVPIQSEEGSDSYDDSVPDIGVPGPSRSGASSRQLLERQINDMSDQLQSLEARNDEQHRETQEQLTSIIKSIESLHTLVLASHAPAPSPSNMIQSGPSASHS